MKTIALVSSCGRSGRTSLTAILATMLARRGHGALAVECDPQNMLALHLGMSTLPAHGLASQPLDTGMWAETALKNSDGVAFVPFGQSTYEELLAFEHTLATQPDWLATRLSMLAHADNMLVLVDAARLPSVYAAQAIRAADYVLVVLQAEGEFFATLAQADAWVSQGGQPHGYLVNAFDTGRTLEHDVLSAMLETLGPRLAPYVIHRDESIPAAFAKLSFVVDAFPQSLAVHDLQGACDWLLRQLGVATVPVDAIAASLAHKAAP